MIKKVRCQKCRKVKDSTSFLKNYRNKNGLSKWCRDCDWLYNPDLNNYWKDNPVYEDFIKGRIDRAFKEDGIKVRGRQGGRRFKDKKKALLSKKINDVGLVKRCVWCKQSRSVSIDFYSGSEGICKVCKRLASKLVSRGHSSAKSRPFIKRLMPLFYKESNIKKHGLIIRKNRQQVHIPHKDGGKVWCGQCKAFREESLFYRRYINNKMYYYNCIFCNNLFNRFRNLKRSPEYKNRMRVVLKRFMPLFNKNKVCQSMTMANGDVRRLVIL